MLSGHLHLQVLHRFQQLLQLQHTLCTPVLQLTTLTAFPLLCRLLCSP